MFDSQFIKILKRKNNKPDFLIGNCKLEIGNYRSGFTIVELLVSIGLFGVIVSIAMGGFVRALRTQRQIVALISANSNVSLAIEQISRELRTGYNFCTGSPACSQTSLSFTNAKGESVVYVYGTETNAHGITYGAILRQVGVGISEQMTAENVDIRYLNFTRLLSASYPERITINIGLSPTSGTAANVSGNITNIQTTVSARSFAG
jgi:prepilin-type N-terminal cleavage/methylation domain-containing protein